MPNPNLNIQLSPTGLAMIQGFEGLRLQAYRDVVGVWTIGYGHTGLEVVAGLSWTAAQAAVALQEDVMWAMRAVQDNVQVALTQNQFDPLVSLVFNIGIGNFQKSTLVLLLNTGNYVGAGGQFGKWIYAGNVVSSGLVKRRQAEANMFLGVGA